MEKLLKLTKAINLVATGFFGFIFVLGGGVELLFHWNIFQIAIIGWLIALGFGILSFRKSIFLIGCLLGWTIFGVGSLMDAKNAVSENSQLCAELRAEPSCFEDACGFQCSNFEGAGFVTGGSVCKDKDMSLCKNKLSSKCAKEGENTGAQGMPEYCCEGLQSMGGWPGNYTGDCSAPPPTGLTICSECGNGICNASTGENKCNCSEDCK